MIDLALMAGSAAGVTPVEMTGIAGGVLIKTEIKVSCMTACGQYRSGITDMTPGSVAAAAGFCSAPERLTPYRAGHICRRISRIGGALNAAVAVRSSAGCIRAGDSLISRIAEIAG